MSKCVNDNCNKNPLESIGYVIVNVDGDAACCLECKEEYEKQKDHFFNVTCHDSKLTKDYLLGK